MKRKLQAFVNSIKRTARKVQKQATDRFAPYEVRCTYGTRQKTWTRSEAMSWFPLCEGLTIIVRRPTGELVASRDPQAV